MPTPSVFSSIADSCSRPPALPLLYRQTIAEDSLQVGTGILFQPYTEETSTERQGLYAQPMPHHLMRVDSIILCFLSILVFILMLRHNYRLTLWESLKNYIFSVHSQLEYRNFLIPKEFYQFIISVVISLQGTIFLFAYVSEQDLLPFNITIWLLLAIGIATFIGLQIGKQFLYHFVHSIFFQKDQRRRWREDYTLLYIFESLFLCIPLILYVFLHLNYLFALLGAGILLLFAKILLLFKCFSTFFTKKYGYLHLFVYFCALEVAPLAVQWTILNEITNHLTNF